MLSRAQMCFAPMISNPKTVNSIRGFLVMRSFRSSMTACAAKSNFAKWKKIASSLAIVSLFCISMSSVELSAGAIDPSQIEVLSDAMTMSILGTGGNDISAYYLASDLTYKPITFSPVNSNLTFTGSDVVGYAPNYWNGKECIVYRCNYAADMYTGLYDSHYYLIPFNCHFDNVTYFEFGVASVDNNGSMYNHYLSQGVQFFRDYNYIIAGDSLSDVYELPTRVNGVNGAFVHCEQWDYPFCCFTYESDTSGEFYLSDCACYPCVSYGNDYLVISNICVNSGYTYLGHGEIPPPPVTTDVSGGGDFSGSGGGVITTDASGNTGFQYTVTMKVPDYILSGSFGQNTDQFPVTVSALASGLDDYGTTAASALSALADEADIDGLWDCAEYFLPAGVVLLIMGCSSVSLAGWILNRYSG